MKKFILILLAFLCFEINAQTSGSTNGWLLNGNGNTGNTSYLGTSNNRSLIIKTNNTRVAKFDSLGKFIIDNPTSRYYFQNLFGGTTPALYMGASTLTPDGSNYTVLQHTGGLFLNDNSGSNVVNLLSGGNVLLQIVGTKTTGVSHNFNFAAISSSGTSSTTAVSNMRVNGGNRGWLGGGVIASQKSSNFTSPSYSATSSSTMTEAFNGYFEKPVASTKMTIQNNFAFGGDGDIGLANNSNLKIKSSDGTYRQIIGLSSGDNITIQGKQGTSDIYLSPFASSVSIICKGINGNVGIKNASPTMTLDVSGNFRATDNTNYLGNMTLISSATNTLTTGKTGTVAVLSDAVFNINFNGTSYNPSDGSTVYLGNHLVVAGASTTGTVTIPYNCTLVGWNFNTYIGGTLASAETATANINYNGSDYLLSSSITFTTLNSQFSGTGLSQNFTAGDRINFKLVHPTYATNPTTCYHGVTLWFVRRQ